MGTAAGKTHVDPAVAGKLFSHVVTPIRVPEHSIAADLSTRERETLALLAQGLSNADIDKILLLSGGTIRNHMTSIFEKAGVADRTGPRGLRGWV